MAPPGTPMSFTERRPYAAHVPESESSEGAESQGMAADPPPAPPVPPGPDDVDDEEESPSPHEKVETSPSAKTERVGAKDRRIPRSLSQS